MLGFGHFGSVAAFIRLTRPKRVRLRYGSRAHLARLRPHHYWIRTLAWLPVKRATTGLGHFTQPDQPGLAWRTKTGPEIGRRPAFLSGHFNLSRSQRRPSRHAVFEHALIKKLHQFRRRQIVYIPQT